MSKWAAIKKYPLRYVQGTLACAVAHNLEQLQQVVDPAVLQEASKTGVVLAAMLTGSGLLQKEPKPEPVPEPGNN